MRACIILISWLLPALTFSQTVNFEDDFSNHDLSNWSGTTADFIFVEEDGNTLLQQNAGGSGISYLSTPSANTVGYWEFFLRLDGFAPSAGNKAEVYLMSDIQDLTGSLNGYKLLAGENGSNDVLRLFKITAGAENGEIITGSTDISSGGDFRIKVTRDAAGNWTLEAAEGYAGALTLEGTGTDNTYTTTTYFGFKNTYTSTRSDKFFYDFKIDISPVKIIDIATVNQYDLDITFSRDVDFNSIQPADFILNPQGITPQSATQQNSETVRISFANPISSGPNSLTVKNIEDAINETTLADTTLSFFVYDYFQSGDIIINEFSKDPPAGAVEYVELKNTTAKFLNLQNWKIGDNNTFTSLSSLAFTLHPDSFAVISIDTAALRSFYGPAHYLQSALPALNNGEDQIRLINSDGVIADSLQYNKNWGGVKVALERRDASVTSIYKENWGESPHPNYGTPGFENQIQPDLLPPQIDGLFVASNQRLVLALSERVVQSSAEAITNYTIRQNPETGAAPPPIPSITSATQFTADSLELLLDNPLQEYDGNWTLEVNNLTDVFGNTANHEVDFNYYLIFTAEPGQVALNEFMYDPAPGFSEFIELYNHTDSSFNLQNWTYSDNSGNDKSIISKSYVLPSGKYVVLAPDSSIIQNFPNVPLIDMGSRFSALNNSGDDIVIKNQNGRMIDSLSYQSSWGGKEISLERRTVNFSGTFKENWGDSPSLNSATPGFKNEITPDTSPPVLESLSILDDDLLEVVFSERLKSAPAELISNFQISADPSFSGTVPNLQTATFVAPDTIRLRFDNALESEPEGTTYQLSIENQSDIFGNVAANLSTSFFRIDYARPDSGKVAISEFMYDPAPGFSEFIEISNRTDSALNLQNWTLNDNTGNRRVISDTAFALLPNSYLVITPDSTMAASFPNIPLLVIGSRFSVLNNNTDAIVFRNAEGSLIDSLTYTRKWGGKEVSLERRSFDFSASFKANWGDSPAEKLATPGQANQIQPDTDAPIITATEVLSDDEVRLIFDEGIRKERAEDIQNFELSTTASGVTAPAIQTTEFLASDTIIVRFQAPFPKKPEGVRYRLRVLNQTDVFGNISPELVGDFFIINYAQPDSGKIFITEFLYDPPDHFSEFVEIYNATDSTFNLQNWTLNDNTGKRKVISDIEAALSPESYLVLTPDSLIFEYDSTVHFLAIGSRFSALNNNTDAIVLRDSSGLLLDSLTYTSNWGGKKASLERRSIQFPATASANWGTSPASEKATPGTENAIQPDISPPEIAHFSVLNDSALQVIFNEQVQKNAAISIGNYSLKPPSDFSQNPPPVQSIQFLPPDTIQLFYERKIPRQPKGSAYELVIQNQTDIFGNTASALSAAFFLIDVSSASPGDVVINEFMYDPEPPLAEFIELYNPTDYSFDLSGWTLNDNTGNRRTIFDAKFVLPTKSYVVLTPDSTLINLFPNRNIAAIGTRFSSLNNNTDAIVIRDENEQLIDSLTYYSDWGGKGVSLERRDVEITSIYKENWGDSPAADGETAGLPNQITPDKTPPVFEQALVIAKDSIRLFFSERLDSTQAATTGNYSISPAQTILKITDYSGEALTLALSAPLISGTTYTITAQNLEDIFGNIMASASVDVEYTVFSSARPKDVIINEILYRRKNANSEEFIELFNTTSQNFNLTGWTLSDAVGTAKIPEGTVLKKDSYLVLTDKKPPSVQAKKKAASALVYVSGFPSLNDDEDAVVIKNAQEEVVDSLFYNRSWGGNEPGVSLERKDPGSASNDASNWGSSTSENGHSAGIQNAIFRVDDIPPELLFAKLQNNGSVDVIFTEFVQIQNARFSINGEETQVVGYAPQDAHKIQLEAAEFPAEKPLTLSVDKVADFSGNTAQNLSIEISRPLVPGNVIINEILFDPLADKDDNIPDQSEYVEFYNRAEYAVSLEGFFIHDEADEHGKVRPITPYNTQFKWIPAGGYAVLYAENATVLFSESKLAQYFELQDEDDTFFIRADRSNLSLASSGDAVYLSDSSGVTIDSVFYDESWQNPNLYTTKGVALERIDPDGPGNDEANWSSSTRVSGGTPGEQNSIFQQSDNFPEETGISFSPNPFSPDDDGFEDLLFINYKLDESDYLLRIRIFDRYGREVRELADGKHAGFEGSIIWDGLKDSGAENRVGIYIVLFEAYNSSSGKKKTFKKTVVLARKF